MGWPLAVSAGLMERSSRALFVALWPLTVGHLLAMLLVRTLMRGIVPIALQILGAVLGVLQVALALNIIISALVRMGIPMTPG